MSEKGPFQSLTQNLYHHLRQNLIKTVFEEYKATGYVWEQYSHEGKGKRSHPFTGWTSLITLIMSEKYP